MVSFSRFRFGLDFSSWTSFVTRWPLPLEICPFCIRPLIFTKYFHNLIHRIFFSSVANKYYYYFYYMMREYVRSCGQFRNMTFEVFTIGTATVTSRARANSCIKIIDTKWITIKVDNGCKTIDCRCGRSQGVGMVFGPLCICKNFTIFVCLFCRQCEEKFVVRIDKIGFLADNRVFFRCCGDWFVFVRIAMRSKRAGVHSVWHYCEYDIQKIVNRCCCENLPSCKIDAN